MHVLVLGGGPDSEREVSLKSAHFIAEALRAAGHTVHNQTIDRVSIDQLQALPGEVIFPALHGGWGEGGPLQDILEADGRPFVGSMSHAARWAMDKIATKFTARAIGIPTTEVRLLDLRDTVCPMPFPVILKPVHDGSTVGLFVCSNDADWALARAKIDQARYTGDGAERVYMIEPCVQRPGGKKARELTVGLIDGKALPVIEIVPADGLYDYEAKYTRNDTQYLVQPALPSGMTERIQRATEEIARAMGIRHLARADFMLDGDNAQSSPSPQAWFLEINTLPGFTDHSLVPKSARQIGVAMPELCTNLVNMAVRDHLGIGVSTHAIA